MGRGWAAGRSGVLDPNSVSLLGAAWEHWGDCRSRPAQLAELATVPAIINREPKHVRRRPLFENVMRGDLNGVELARILVQTMEGDGLESKGMADQLELAVAKGPAPALLEEVVGYPLRLLLECEAAGVALEARQAGNRVHV